MTLQKNTRDQLPSELLELRKEIDLLPRSLRQRMGPLCERVTDYTLLLNRLLRVAQDAVDQLQLDVKYLTFDVHATRQERDALREELENS